MKKRIGFYCSGGASRLLKFYTDKDSIAIFHPVFIYYDGSRKDVVESIKKLLPDVLLISSDPSSQKRPNQYVSDELLDIANRLEIDYIFCFGERLLKSPLIDRYENRIINFHPSLLPAFPGLQSIDQALETSVTLLGNTAHFIDRGVDTGPIIMQSVLPRNLFVSYEDVLSLQLPMLKQIWLWLEEGAITVDKKMVSIKNNPKAEVLFSPSLSINNYNEK